jgi:hypothetical protein
VAPLIIDGVGQFEVEVASEWPIYVRMSEAVTKRFTGGTNLRTFVRRIGFRQGTELPYLPADRVWIQRSQGDAVLVIRRADGPENAAFVYLGELHQIARKSAYSVNGVGWVQVFLVFGDERLNDVLSRASPVGRITYPTMFGALVNCTSEG